MSGEWKPGDVAMVTSGDVKVTDPRACPEFETVLGVRTGQYGKGGWNQADGHWIADEYVYEVRPLVVIDPEDREQVERLRQAILDAQGGTFVEDIRLALRELADPKPPKPAEPTGLGAVVETQPMIVNEDGDTASVLIRHADGLWWTNGEGGWYWADVPAVRVLSEGVTS